MRAVQKQCEDLFLSLLLAQIVRKKSQGACFPSLLPGHISQNFIEDQLGCRQLDVAESLEFSLDLIGSRLKGNC